MKKQTLDISYKLNNERLITIKLCQAANSNEHPNRFMIALTAPIDTCELNPLKLMSDKTKQYTLEIGIGDKFTHKFIGAFTNYMIDVRTEANVIMHFAGYLVK
jgi:hypothetical protein